VQWGRREMKDNLGTTIKIAVPSMEPRMIMKSVQDDAIKNKEVANAKATT
jgi:hypothetical protein